MVFGKCKRNFCDWTTQKKLWDHKCGVTKMNAIFFGYLPSILKIKLSQDEYQDFFVLLLKIFFRKDLI